MPAPPARAGFKKPQMNFGGHCIKKFGRISSRTLTDFARAACAVLRTQSVRPDHAGSASARGVPRGKPKNFLAFFSRLLPPPLRREAEKNGKEIFGLLLPLQIYLENC